MFLQRTLILVVVAIFVGGCLWGDPSVSKAVEGDVESISDSEAPKNEKGTIKKKVVVFFLIVNEMRKDILVNVTANGKELFAQEVLAEVKKNTGEVPPFSGKYPAKEIKAEVGKDVRTIEVKEIHSERRAVYDITNLSTKANGLRITIRENGIFLTHDYFPIF